MTDTPLTDAQHAYRVRKRVIELNHAIAEAHAAGIFVLMTTARHFGPDQPPMPPFEVRAVVIKRPPVADEEAKIL